MGLIREEVEFTLAVNNRKITRYINVVKCDTCNVEYILPKSKRDAQLKRKLANNKDVCKLCMKLASSEHIKSVGRVSLLAITKEQRKINASNAGKISAKRNNDNPNNGRFTTERWLSMTPEEQHNQVMRASNGLQEKLKDPIYSAMHFSKVMSQTKIGYMSKGHKDLHGLLIQFGFISHYQISSMQVDECNPELKIVIEYNGDMWHCNPKTWKCDEYNSAIKMTAGEKWKKDLVRYDILRKFGYRVIVIWESEWQKNAQKYLDRIKGVYNEISENGKNRKTNML